MSNIQDLIPNKLPTKGILTFTDSNGVRTSIEDLWSIVYVDFDNSWHAIGTYHTVTDIDTRSPNFVPSDITVQRTVYATLNVPAKDLKMLREHLCVVQQGLLTSEGKSMIGGVISEIDKHRPLGPDGRHNNLHTSTCGCEFE